MEPHHDNAPISPLTNATLLCGTHTPTPAGAAITAEEYYPKSSTYNHHSSSRNDDYHHHDHHRQPNHSSSAVDPPYRGGGGGGGGGERCFSPQSDHAQYASDVDSSVENRIPPGDNRESHRNQYRGDGQKYQQYNSTRDDSRFEESYSREQRHFSHPPKITSYDKRHDDMEQTTPRDVPKQVVAYPVETASYSRERRRHNSHVPTPERRDDYSASSYQSHSSTSAPRQGPTNEYSYYSNTNSITHNHHRHPSPDRYNEGYGRQDKPQLRVEIPISPNVPQGRVSSHGTDSRGSNNYSHAPSHHHNPHHNSNMHGPNTHSSTYSASIESKDYPVTSGQNHSYGSAPLHSSSNNPRPPPPPPPPPLQHQSNRSRPPKSPRVIVANEQRHQSEARHQILKEIRQATNMRNSALDDDDRGFWDRQIATLNESFKKL